MAADRARIKISYFSDEAEEVTVSPHWEWVGESDECIMTPVFFYNSVGLFRSIDPAVGLRFVVGPFEVEVVEVGAQGIIVRRIEAETASPSPNLPIISE